MRRRLTFILPVFAIALMFGSPARAAAAADPQGLVKDLVAQAISTIADKQAPQDAREAKFRALLESGFDIPRISRFVLGRYWNSAADPDKQAFGTLFEEWIVRTYSARFRDYGGQTIQVTGSRPESETNTVVLSQFVSTNGAPPAKVEWHVRKEADGGFKIVDVSVEGVSMALTQRDEIAAVADRNGGTVEGLNKALKERLSAGNDSASK